MKRVREAWCCTRAWNAHVKNSNAPSPVQLPTRAPNHINRCEAAAVTAAIQKVHSVACKDLIRRCNLRQGGQKIAGI